MQKSQKKTVMNHNLAKALMEAGMEHFDVGGVVSGPGSGIGNDISGGYSQVVQGILAPTTGILNGLSGATTVQNKYEADLAPTDYANYGGAIANGQNQIMEGYQRAGQDRQRQQMLHDILSASANGQGPSPAAAEYAKNTGDNIAAQTALMAGTRGGGANVGLLAKQAGQAGGQIQQQAASDAAILKANEQIAARQQLQQQQALMGGQNIAEQGVGLNLLNTGANAQSNQNKANIENYGMAQGINAKTSQNNADAVNSRQGGLLKALPMIGGLFSKGGEVPDHIHQMAKLVHPQHFDSGGFVQEYRNSGPKQEEKSNSMGDIMEILGPMLMAAGGMKNGGKVPGKASVKGDSVKNDTVPILVSPQEVVLPRSVTQAKDAPSKAAEFMRHLQDKKEKKDYGRVAQSKKSLKERVAMLESYCMGGKVK